MDNVKECIKCFEIKELSFFYKRKNYDGTDGYRNDCKECNNAKSRKYSNNNRDKILEQKKEYYLENKDCISEKNKKYHIDNKEFLNKKSKEYYQDNKEILLAKAKIYIENNKEKIALKDKKYYEDNKDIIIFKKLLYAKERRKNDNFFRLSSNIRSGVGNSIRRLGFSKKSNTEFIIGCSFEEFKLHLESKFEDWMTWENYGKYNGEFNYGWDIDHKIPLSSAETEEDIIRLNNYTNLQPLCSKVNRYIKKDKQIDEN